MNKDQLINFAYLIASVLFILGIKGLTHPRTALSGNLKSAVGMLIAIVAVLFDKNVLSFGLILTGIGIGTVIGLVLALKVQMTGMPQLVAMLNGFGGMASLLVAAAELYQHEHNPLKQFAQSLHGPNIQILISIAVTALIGALTFTGSIMAFGKLQELISGNSIVFSGQQPLNAGLGLAAVVLCIVYISDPSQVWAFWAMVGLSALLGVLLTMPIGGADMPVVISLLNSYSGLAAAAAGFILSNNALIISGSLVGASGIILTNIMCKAMNRSLMNVILGLGQAGVSKSADDVYEGRIKATSAEEIAMMLDGAQKVVVVPGYGMAVSQAQHAVRDLAQALENKGTEVLYAIHPVAGRMPGHMNVLLAEADVPYDKLKDMDEVNPAFEQTDVAIVVGANDVVNPLARTDPKSPIAGMPILNVDKARTVIVVKRSLSPGFAGIPNPLFAADNCLMYFADGKKAFIDILNAVKES